MVDSFHLSFGQRGRIEAAIRRFLGRHLGEVDVASVVVLGMQPRASVFSSSIPIVLSSLDSASLSGPLTGSDGGLNLGTEEASEAFAGALASEGAMVAEQSLAQLAVAARALGELRGVRKAVLFFSEGIGTNLFPSANPQARDAAQRVLEAQKTFIRAASAADVAVYPIDVRGLAAISPFSSGEPDGFREWSSLRVLADGTGGIAFVGRRDLDPVFDQIVTDTSDYYQLGYYSTTKSDRRFHSLEITCRREGVVLRTRTSTPAPRPETGAPGAVPPSLRSLLDRALPIDGGGIELSASATPTRLASDAAEITVNVEIRSWGSAVPVDATFPSTAPQPQVGIAVYDPSGRRLLERVVALPSKGHSLTTSIQVPRRMWQVRVAALAENGRFQGSVFLDLDMRPVRTR